MKCIKKYFSSEEHDKRPILFTYSRRKKEKSIISYSQFRLMYLYSFCNLMLSLRLLSLAVI